MESHPEEHYYKLNRLLLVATGLWPYQSIKDARVKRALITVVMLTSLFVQMASVFTSEITIDYLVELLPILVPTFGTLIHLYMRVIHMNKLRKIFEHMWKDWALQKTDDEVKIMHKYAETSRLMSFYFTLQLFGSGLILMAYLYMSEILNIISPMNVSRLPKIYLKIHYIVPMEQHISLVRLHIFVVMFVMAIVFMSSFTLLVAVTQHGCGMYELLGYRAERLFYVNQNKVNHDLSNRTKLIYKNMVVFVRLHHNVIQYNSEWYDAIVAQQKLLLLIMSRCFQPFVLTACKFYVTSLPNLEK
ncbi:PREDICTED: uncharacterized protein LOC106749370, partial [Dinoponera quadriceps]|uniref:Uncharacterized protein LOC106749370 n=1 Tax=Dinoponera quadriceps TaxID=609295 RepID=A0A6P3Y089_DINQU